MNNDIVPEFAVRVPLRDDSDVSHARRRVRVLGAEHGMMSHAVEELATAVSEVARNAIEHARGGEMLLGTTRQAGQVAIVAIAIDGGPGISSLEDAMRDGFTTGHGLGLGLPSARRMVDSFEIQSILGRGTRVTLTKWIKGRSS